MDPTPRPVSPASPAPPAPSAPAKPLRTALRLLLPLAGVAALLLLVVALLGGTARWLLATDAGTAWLLARLPMVQVIGYKGALLGERWRADSLRVQWTSAAGVPQWLLIEGLAADGLRWQWRPNPHAWVALQADRVAARKLTLHLGPPTGAPLTLPERIAPPLQLAVADARIDEAVVEGMQPLRALQLRGLVLDPRPGASHRVEQIDGQGYGITLGGAFALGNSAPLQVRANASLRPSADGDAPRWGAVLQAAGALRELQLTGTLRGKPLAGRDAPSVDLRTTLRPLQAWPFGELSLRTQALDLSALWPGAPSTRLSGNAELRGGGAGAPLQGTLQLRNAEPGRNDEHRLPVQQLTLEVHGQLPAAGARADRIEFRRFELLLADARHAAGRWSGSAVWQGTTLLLDTVLADVRPQQLDGRAAAMTLSGPVSATLRGLPSPDITAASGTPAATAAASAAAPQRAAASAPAATAAVAPLHITWSADLQGKLDAAPQPVRLTLQGQADAQHVEVKTARAQAGKASAEFNVLLARVAGRGDWQLDSAGKLSNFDPLPWWPGAAGAAGSPAAAWRQGPHRLSGDWQFALRLPADAARLAPLTLAQRSVGNGNLHIRDSMLAGVPLSADVALAYTPAAAPTPASLHAEVTLGGNQLVVDGRADPAGSGSADRWRVDLNADALAALAPLARLDATLAAWAPRGGSVQATLAGSGRWPALRTEGSARIAQLAAGRLALARADATWRFDSAGDQPVALQLDLAGLALDQQRVEQLHANIRGTLADHTIEVGAALPLLAPPLAQQLLGVAAQAGTRALLQAQGAWQPDPAGGGRWRARVQRVLLGSWDGKPVTAPLATGWAEARDLQAELQFGPGAKLVALQADAGRLRVGDSLAMRWDDVRVDLRGALPQIALRADIEPFLVAPLLARATPNVSWQGDLRLKARLDIRAAERFDADVVFERADGDLHVTNGEGTQLLGLTDLRLALAAHDGVWNFTPLLRGRSLGEIAGQLKVVTTPERRWPHADAALSGSVQARAADIGIYSAWVPAGWRLAGEVHVLAGIGGTFAAPQYTGEVGGSKLGVRNLLQGVNVSDGQISAKLAGDSAQIERFTLRGGDGTITITGGATFGDKPQARLRLQAERFRVLGRVDRQIIVSGNADMLFQRDGAKVDGKFTVDEGLIDASRRDAPSLDDDVTVRRPGDRVEVAADPAAQRPPFNLALGIDLDLGDKLRVRGFGVDTALRGQLRLTTPNRRLAINGTISTEGGTFAAYGQKLVIERGIAAFNGPFDNPRLDILALRPNIDMRVGASITGNFQTYRLRLYSEPEMSDNDKLAWLVLGRAPDGLGRNDTALLQRAAVALFAGEGEAPTDQLMKALGIDDVSLRQGDGEVRETVITIGKQLSRRWYLGYERGVNSTTGTWQLIYRIAQRFTLKLQSGLENAVDLNWTWRRQETPTDASMRKSTVIPPPRPP